MMRRAAKRTDTNQAGFVLDGLKHIDTTGNETFVFVFEQIAGQTTPAADPGFVSEVAVGLITFTDGSPAAVAVM